jgi:hypothetical protein
LGHPEEEPSAGKPHARICEGEAEWLSYSTAARRQLEKMDLAEGFDLAARRFSQLVHILSSDEPHERRPDLASLLSRMQKALFDKQVEQFHLGIRELRRLLEDPGDYGPLG